MSASASLTRPFNLRNPAHVELPASLVAPPPNPQTGATAAPPPPPPPAAASLRKENKKKYHLSSADSLFMELRDVNFSNVGKRLNGVARRLEEDYKVWTRFMSLAPPE